jgi:hypothetical protein
MASVESYGTANGTTGHQYDLAGRAAMITISEEEYNKMLDRIMWLEALEAAGVDNWQGFDEACEIYKEWMQE